MAGYMTNAERARTLDARFAGTLYLGLATGLTDDPATTTLANLVEVTTAGYARKQIPAFDPASTTAPVQKVVPTAFAFNALTADMTVPANYAFITTAASGTVGEIRYIFELVAPLLGRAGEPINIPANALIIE